MRPSLDTLILAYKALSQPLFQYSISAWGEASNTVLIKLERVQKSVSKVIFKG